MYSKGIVKTVWEREKKRDKRETGSETNNQERWASTTRLTSLNKACMWPNLLVWVHIARGLGCTKLLTIRMSVCVLARTFVHMHVFLSTIVYFKSPGPLFTKEHERNFKAPILKRRRHFSGQFQPNFEGLWPTKVWAIDRQCHVMSTN